MGEATAASSDGYDNSDAEGGGGGGLIFFLSCVDAT